MNPYLEYHLSMLVRINIAKVHRKLQRAHGWLKQLLSNDPWPALGMRNRVRIPHAKNDSRPGQISIAVDENSEAFQDFWKRVLGSFDFTDAEVREIDGKGRVIVNDVYDVTPEKELWPTFKLSPNAKASKQLVDVPVRPRHFDLDSVGVQPRLGVDTTAKYFEFTEEDIAFGQQKLAEASEYPYLEQAIESTDRGLLGSALSTFVEGCANVRDQYQVEVDLGKARGDATAPDCARNWALPRLEALASELTSDEDRFFASRIVQELTINFKGYSEGAVAMVVEEECPAIMADYMLALGKAGANIPEVLAARNRALTKLSSLYSDLGCIRISPKDQEFAKANFANVTRKIECEMDTALLGSGASHRCDDIELNCISCTSDCFWRVTKEEPAALESSVEEESPKEPEEPKD
jgi:hypothetical protein